MGVGGGTGVSGWVEEEWIKKRQRQCTCTRERRSGVGGGEGRERSETASLQSLSLLVKKENC